MNDEAESIWTEVVVASSRHYPEMLLEAKRKSRIDSALAKVRIKYLLNTSQQRYL
jgi:hypothetical protein